MQRFPVTAVLRVVNNVPMQIEASAPTRIDLAGGTLDIWPLYLFHHGAQTINAAISLRAWCEIRPRTDRRLVIVSDDAGQRVEVDHWSQLRDTHDLKLLGRLLHYFQAEGLELRTRSESPVGAGIAGSSALNIAVCGALNAWSGGRRSADQIFQIAMNVEAQAIDVPTGVQDYRPAYYGGISAVELGVDGIRRVPLDVGTDELQARLAAAAAAGALAGKVCGAGGGGCLFCFADPDRIPAVKQALAATGAKGLDFRIESEGLRIVRREAADGAERTEKRNSPQR